MRDLTTPEMGAVSGGQLTEAEAAAATIALMAVSTTPLVVVVGTLALLYYAWC